MSKKCKKYYEKYTTVTIPRALFPSDGVVGNVRPEDMVALVIDDRPWSEYWQHGSGSKTLRM